VLIIALIPEPILRSDARNRISPITTPIKPLTISMRYSYCVKKGKGSDWISKTVINPETPTIFFNKLIWMLFNALPAMSKHITADDQQSAVRIA
tara:strand:+ start:462 stop:743 length:282 start_codon:yes stop_codon:yes gene_type:complete